MNLVIIASKLIIGSPVEIGCSSVARITYIWQSKKIEIKNIAQISFLILVHKNTFLEGYCEVGVTYLLEWGEKKKYHISKCSLSFCFMLQTGEFRFKILCKQEGTSNQKRFPCVRFSVGCRAVCQFSAGCFWAGSELPSSAAHDICSACACVVWAVGGSLLAAGRASRAGSICRRVGKAGEQQPAPSQLIPTGKGCSESDPDHRRHCLTWDPSLPTHLEGAQTQNLCPLTASLSRKVCASWISCSPAPNPYSSLCS